MSINIISTHNKKTHNKVKRSPNNLLNHQNYFFFLEGLVIVGIVAGLGWARLGWVFVGLMLGWIEANEDNYVLLKQESHDQILQYVKHVTQMIISLITCFQLLHQLDNDLISTIERRRTMQHSLCFFKIMLCHVLCYLN